MFYNYTMCKCYDMKTIGIDFYIINSCVKNFDQMKYTDGLVRARTAV